MNFFVSLDRTFFDKILVREIKLIKECNNCLRLIRNLEVVNEN